MIHLTDAQLNEYLDDTLDETTKRAIEAHLQTCRDCIARLVELRDLFASLQDLQEVPLRRDLSPAILALLPHKQTRIWSPFFAAQLGAALGLFFWLSMEANDFVTPIISSLHFPWFAILVPWSANPSIDLPDLYLLLPRLESLISIPGLQLVPFMARAIRLSISNFSPVGFVSLAISVFLLWLVVNLSLLRNRAGHSE